MIEGQHYHVDFTTFSRILGSDVEHRGFSYIHDEQIWEEEALEMAGPIIPPNACP